MDGPDSADGTLVIMVCRAKHLPNRRKLDKQSPYVLLRIGLTANRTPSHFRAGQTPEWTHEIRFQLSRDRKPLLKLDVLDETKSDPTPVSGTEIDCSQVFQTPANLQESGKYILDSWYDLTCNGRQAGTIYLEMTFYPSAPVLPPKLSYSSEAKVLPLAPEEPDFSSLAPLPENDNDDLFVSGDYKKRSSIFRSSDPGIQPKDDSVFVTGEPKKSSRFAKLKSKLRSREPILSMWSDKNPTSSTVAEHNDLTPNMSPIDNLERLRVDIGGEVSPVPPPPPHSDYGSFNLSPVRTPVKSLPSQSPSPNRYYNRSPEKSPSFPDQSRTSPKRTLRKPPPDISENMAGLELSGKKAVPYSANTTAIPFSADTIGLDDDDALPTKVFHLGQAVQLLTHDSRLSVVHENPHEIDPRYYAPTPTEKMARSWRLQNGEGRSKDYKVDLNTDTTGYLGEGKWRTDRFSPSVFQRINDENGGFENKPTVPPKIPQGLSEVEYYVLEKDSYLKDINGRRM